MDVFIDEGQWVQRVPAQDAPVDPRLAALTRALLEGSVEEVNEALRAGADPNGVDPAYDEPVLMHAFHCPEKLAVMLAAGSQVDAGVEVEVVIDKDGEFVQILYLTIVEALLKAACESEYETATNGAPDVDYSASLTLLLEHGADWRVSPFFEVPARLAAILREHEASHLEKVLPPPAPATSSIKGRF